MENTGSGTPGSCSDATRDAVVLGAFCGSSLQLAVLFRRVCGVPFWQWIRRLGWGGVAVPQAYLSEEFARQSQWEVKKKLQVKAAVAYGRAAQARATSGQ